jgi:hypothetical protein
MRTTKMLICATVLTAAFTAIGATATAGTTRLSQGDAEAVLHASGNGGWAVRLHSKHENPPAAVASDAGIRPFPGWDTHYCVLDWHVLLVSYVDGGDRSYSQKDAEAILSPLELTFTLDGEPLATTRTPIKRYLNGSRFDWDKAYYIQQGRVVAPGELTVGEHVFHLTTVEPGYGTYEDEITLSIDAQGTGACR